MGRVEAGLVNPYRHVHDDPLTAPGVTWSPIYETFTGGYGHDDHIGEPEPQDRIDFVLTQGRWEVTSSETVLFGTPAPIPNRGDNEWTTDHTAVLTTFRIS